MNLITEFSERASVWVLNPKTGQVVQREIFAVRTQSLRGHQSTIYAFIKDWCLDKEEPTLEDCFWLSEGKVFASKKSLINSL